MAKDTMHTKVAIRTAAIQFIWSALEGELQITKSSILFKSSSGSQDMSWPKKQIQLKSRFWTGYLRIQDNDGKRYWVSTYTKRWNLFVGTPLFIIYAFLLVWDSSHPSSTLLGLVWLLFALIVLGLFVLHYMKFLDMRKRLQRYGYLQAKHAPSSSA